MALSVVLVKTSLIVFPLPLPVVGVMPATHARVQVIEDDISVAIGKGISKSISEQVDCIVAGVVNTG
jgi:hypothetical protein